MRVLCWGLKHTNMYDLYDVLCEDRNRENLKKAILDKSKADVYVEFIKSAWLWIEGYIGYIKWSDQQSGNVTLR